MVETITITFGLQEKIACLQLEMIGCMCDYLAVYLDSAKSSPVPD